MMENHVQRVQEVSDVFNAGIDGTDANAFRWGLQMVNIHLSQLLMATIDKNAQTLLKNTILVIC